MNNPRKNIKNKIIAIALIGTMMLSETPVFAAESQESETFIELPGSEPSEETSEASEAEQSESEMEEETNEESETIIETASIDTELEESQSAENLSAAEIENKDITNRSTDTSTFKNDNTLAKYSLEGYAASYRVTGGGILTTDDTNYYTANTEKEFLDALAKAKNGTPTVIEITKDMELGNLELKKQGISIQGHNTPLLHPTLLKTGVSKLSLNCKNLTIFSKNGSAIKHCGIDINSAKNLIIRNIVFDELWEWDENTAGEYDRNDWDYITIQGSDGVWIDHCTFYKAYDGVVDIKKPSSASNVTVSWCRFLPGSKDNTFFDEMMDYLDTHKDSMPYYKSLLDQGLTKEQIWQYAYGQKKTSLLGQSDSATDAKGIRLTLANNYYLDSMERLPRLRYGTVHEYNCVLDSQDLYDWREASELLKSKIVSNGAISTCDGQMLLENCYIKGIENPLVSGNANSRPGYINARGSVYYIGDTDKTDELAPKNNNADSYSGSREVLVTNSETFIKALPYSDYNKYPAESLNRDIVPRTGAGVLTMTGEQWQKTAYLPTEEAETGENSTEESSSIGESSSEESSDSGSESGSTQESESSEGSSTDSDTEYGGIQIVGLNKRVYEYTGEKIIPEFDVYDGEKLLSQGVDYTVTYKDNKNPGTATIIVKGKGNYAASKKNEAKATFEIVEADSVKQEALANIKGAKIIKLTDVSYNPDGTPYNPPIIELTLKNKTKATYQYNETKHMYEKDGEDMDVRIAVSNNINKGTASVLVTGVDEKGKLVKIKSRFKIKPIDLSLDQTTVAVEVSDAEYVVNSAIPKTLNVTYDGKKLTLGKDYTVKYANNKKAGAQATVTVIGKGNYTKKVSKSYNVVKADLSDFRVAAVTAHSGMKKAGKIKATVVDKNGNALNAKQYRLEICHAAEAEGVRTKGALYSDTEPLVAGGYIFVRAVAKDTLNFTENTATADAEFKIGIDISKAKFPLKKGFVKSYTGSAVTLKESDFDTEKVMIKVNGKTEKLTMGIDYEIVPYAYANNINKGTATAVIRGIGAYSGTKTIKFKITQKTIMSVELRDVLRSMLEEVAG